LDALISCSIAQAYSTEVLTCVHCSLCGVLSSDVACRLLALFRWSVMMQQTGRQLCRGHVARPLQPRSVGLIFGSCTLVWFVDETLMDCWTAG